ncbi:hypothetical protein DL769_006404 [Monosporascus sp. CRB-8-3]|nr:hypothetical protein DL769_006404 [Monosporascus sp. CRB-8-3]
MVSLKSLGGAAVASYLVAQQCRCPPPAIGLLITSALTAIGEVVKEVTVRSDGPIIYGRQVTAPPGVPQFEFDRCNADMGRAHLFVQGPVSNRGIRVEGVPPTCMNLAAVLDGDAVQGPVPIPCGSACLIYDNLTPAEYEQIRVIFEANKTG